MSEGYFSVSTVDDMTSFTPLTSSEDGEQQDMFKVIFTKCDLRNTGLVKVSSLVDYMGKEAGSDPGRWEIIERVRTLLDPEDQNVAVDYESFVECMSSIAEEEKEHEDILSAVRESPDGSSGSTYADVYDCTLQNYSYYEDSFSCGDTSILSNSAIVDELKEELLEKTKEIQNLQNQIVKLQNQLKSCEADNKNIQEEYETLAQKHLKNRDKNAALNAEITKLKESMLAAEGNSATYFENWHAAQRELTALRRDFKTLEAQKKELTLNLEQETINKDVALQKYHTLQEEIIKLRKENRTLHDDNGYLNVKVNDLEGAMNNLTFENAMLKELNESLSMKVKPDEDDALYQMVSNSQSKLLYSPTLDSGDSDIIHPSVLREHAKASASNTHPSLLAEFNSLVAQGNDSEKSNVSLTEIDNSAGDNFGSPTSKIPIPRRRLSNIPHKSTENFGRRLSGDNRLPLYTSTPARFSPTFQKLRFSGLSPKRRSVGTFNHVSCQTEDIKTRDASSQIGSNSFADSGTQIETSVNVCATTQTPPLIVNRKKKLFHKLTQTRESQTRILRANVLTSKSLVTPVTSRTHRPAFTSPRGTRYASFTTCRLLRKRSVEIQTNVLCLTGDNTLDKCFSLASTQTDSGASLNPRKRTRYISCPESTDLLPYHDHGLRYNWQHSLQRSGLLSFVGQQTQLDNWLRNTLELENIKLRRHGVPLRITDRAHATSSRLAIMEPDLVNVLPIRHRPEMASAISSVSMQRAVSLEERQRPGSATLQEEASRRMSEGGLTPVLSSNGSETDSSSSINHVEVFPCIPDALLHQLGLAYDKERPPASETLTEQDIENRFLALSLAFKSDKSTLSDRYELQHKQRDQAERNMAAEVLRLKAVVHDLNYLCIDSESVEILSKIQNQVDVLQQATDRVSNSAEMFGAVQQEHRLNKAVEVMLAHVENLKRLYEKEHAELEETRRVLSENNIVMEEAVDSVDEPSSRSASRYRSLSSSGLSKVNSKRRASIAALPRPSLSIDSSKHGLPNSLVDGKSRVCGTVRRRTSMNVMLSGTSNDNSSGTWDTPECLERTANGPMDEIKEVAESRRESGASEQELNLSLKFSEENNNCKPVLDSVLRREHSEQLLNTMSRFEDQDEGEGHDEQDQDTYDEDDEHLPSCGDALGLLAEQMAMWTLHIREQFLEPYIPLDNEVLSRYIRYGIAFLFVLAAIWIVGSSFLPSEASANEDHSMYSCFSWQDLGSVFSVRHYEPPPM